MEPQRNPTPSGAPAPKFTVYQNCALTAALTAASLRPSAAALLFVAASFIISTVCLIAATSRGDYLAGCLTRIHVPHTIALWFVKVVQAASLICFVASLSALWRAVSLHTARILPPAKDHQKNQLTDRQLELLGFKPKPKPAEQAKPPKSRATPSRSASDVLVPIRKWGSSNSNSNTKTPSRPSPTWSDRSLGSGIRVAVSPLSAPPATPWYGASPVASWSTASPSPSKYGVSPVTPWSKRSSGSAKGIVTEAKLEEFLADFDAKFMESIVQVDATPSPAVCGFGVVSPGSVATATTNSTARSTPLRPVRMSPGSHKKYSTPAKKGDVELPSPMTMQQTVDAFVSLGIYSHIEEWRDRLRQWFSSFLLNPLLDKIETSHIQVMQAAAAVGVSTTVNQVGCESADIVTPSNASEIDGSKEWQPIYMLDEDGVLLRLRSALVQARDGSIAQVPFGSQQQFQQNPQLPLIQACLDAITEHQSLKVLMKGQLVKGLLPHSNIRADYTVQRVEELAEGTCLKNYDYTGNGDGYGKAQKRWASGLPCDSHLLLYLFCAFLEQPKWMLHVDPTSYYGAQSSKNPLFVGILPPKDRFPEKYVAIISGVPSILHPGACILSVGQQDPPLFALYWDKKLQFSLQGRTALWDALLLLCHRIKTEYGGVVRGVHLDSPAFNLLPVLECS